ncbi:MAG: hypothetical protein ACRDOG_13715 [Gaiellaceae bacterium]
MRIAATVALVGTLWAGACGGDQKGLVPERPTNEQTLRLVRSCEVKSIVFIHGGEVHLTLRGGRMVFVARPDRTALADAAEDASMDCGIAIGLE